MGWTIAGGYADVRKTETEKPNGDYPVCGKELRYVCAPGHVV